MLNSGADTAVAKPRGRQRPDRRSASADLRLPQRANPRLPIPDAQAITVRTNDDGCFQYGTTGSPTPNGTVFGYADYAVQEGLATAAATAMGFPAALTAPYTTPGNQYGKRMPGPYWHKGSGAWAVSIAMITDGTSETIGWMENAGRPALYVGNRLAAANLADPTEDTSIVKDGWGWADTEMAAFIDGAGDFSAVLGASANTCFVNCTNNGEIYAFHPGGAQVSYVDGSVHFLTPETSPYVIGALCTMNLGEIVSNPD